MDVSTAAGPHPDSPDLTPATGLHAGHPPTPTLKLTPTDSPAQDDYFPSTSVLNDSAADPASPTGPSAPGFSSTMADHQNALAHPYGTRLKNNIRQSKTHIDGIVTYSVSRVPSAEPSSHVTAMKHPMWHHAMQEEFDALI
jgi:hypothetical protein